MSVDLSSLGQIKLKGTGTGNGVLTISAPANLNYDVTQTLGVDPVYSTDLSVADTLDPFDSGKIFNIVQGAAAFTVTLPPATAGLNLKLVLKTAGAKDVTIARAGTDVISGILSDCAGTQVDKAAATSFAFVTAKAVAGDYAELNCPFAGYWIVKGFSKVAGGFA